MKSCAFFGDECFDYTKEKAAIRAVLLDLIENKGVTHFYATLSSDFDWACFKILSDLKDEGYTQIVRVRIGFHGFPKIPALYCDKEICWLKQSVAPNYDKAETYVQMSRHADYIVSGIIYDRGYNYKMVNNLWKLGKSAIDIRIMAQAMSHVVS